MSDQRKSKGMTKEQLDLQGRRHDDPLGQPDFQEIEKYFEDHRAIISRAIAINGWTERWTRQWTEETRKFRAATPHSDQWYLAGLQCLRLTSRLVEFRRQASLDPGALPRRLPSLGQGRHKGVVVAIAKLVVLRLRSTQIDGGPAGIAERNLPWYMLLYRAPYPETPWSLRAVKSLAQARGWGKYMDKDILKDGVVPRVLPDSETLRNLPDSAALWSALHPLLEILDAGSHAQLQHLQTFQNLTCHRSHS